MQTDGLRELYDAFTQASPTIHGLSMSMFLAFLRVVTKRAEESRLAGAAEVLMCGALAVAINSGIQAAGYTGEWGVFIGAGVGLYGTNRVKAWGQRVLERKAEKV